MTKMPTQKHSEVDTEMVQWLIFNSGLSVYEISKRSGLNESQVGKYRNGKTDVDNMSIRYAKELTRVAKELR